MNKKIIFKTLVFPRVSETFIVSNIIEAVKNGFEVEIIAETINPIESSSQQALLRQYNLMDLLTSVRQPQNKLERVSYFLLYLINPINLIFFFKYLIVKRRFSLSYIFILNFYKKYKNKGVFHIHFANASEDIAILKEIGFLKNDILLTMHGYDAFYGTESEKLILQEKYNYTFKNAKRVFINTSYLKDKVIALNCPDNKIEVIPIGINLDFYTPSNHPKTLGTTERVKLVSVGRLIELKGHEYGIQALKLLIDRGFNVDYTIIGEGKRFSFLNNLIDELNLNDHIRLLGKKTQEEVKAVLEDSHIFLMVSVKDNNGREEAQGIVTAEAQSMGLPVVGFDSGGIPNTVTNNTSILVAQKDVKALSNAIMSIITESKLSPMSIASRKWVTSNFGLEKMVNRYYKNIT